MTEKDPTVVSTLQFLFAPYHRFPAVTPRAVKLPRASTAFLTESTAAQTTESVTLLICVEFLRGCMACDDLVNFLNLWATLGRVFSQLLNWLATGYNPVSRKIIRPFNLGYISRTVIVCFVVLWHTYKYGSDVPHDCVTSRTKLALIALLCPSAQNTVHFGPPRSAG